MTKHEYLDRLNDALGDMESQERADIILEMESHIDELAKRHAETGEEDLVALLSSPGRVAAGILIECNMADGGKNERAEASKDSGGNWRGVWGGIQDFLEHIRASTGESVDFERSIPGEGLVRVEVELLSADAYIRRTEESALHLRVEGLYDQEQLLLTMEDSVLKIAEKVRSGESLEEFHLEIPGSIGAVFIKTASGDISLEDLSCELIAQSASGSISASGCGDAISATTASGDISVSDCTDVAGSSASGDIVVENARGRVAVKTLSGDVSIQDADEDVGVETVSGEIEIESVHGPLATRTQSGSISVSAVGGLVLVSSASGDVELDSSEGFSGAEISAGSGSVSVELPEDVDALITASSGSGDVSIGERDAGHGDIKLGSGEHRLIVKTGSGDISVEY